MGESGNAQPRHTTKNVSNFNSGFINGFQTVVSAHLFESVSYFDLIIIFNSDFQAITLINKTAQSTSPNSEQSVHHLLRKLSTLSARNSRLVWVLLLTG